MSDLRKWAALTILAVCTGLFCNANRPPARVALGATDELVGGGICQYPIEQWTCTSCVNEWECDSDTPGGLYACQSYTGGALIYTCTLNTAGICDGTAWQTINCVVFTGFFDACATQFNSYNLSGEPGSCG
jgi:hypothetical protein